LRELFRVIQRARHENYLFSAMLGICAFYFIGSFAQLNIIGFGIQSLRLNEIEGGYLFVVAAVGIAVGSFLIGKICADRVEIGFAPICALLMGIILLCVPLIQHHLVLIVAALLLLGLFGGMFLVPFEAYIQAASPDSHRGENVAAGNFLSFIGMLISTGFLALLGGVFGLSAAQGFASLGIVALAIAAIQFHRFPDALVRLLSRALFPSKRERLVVQGRELFSTPFASLNICITSEWKWALLAMTALQQRYMKFLIEAPPSLSWKERWLVRLSKAVIYATPLANDEKAVAAGRNWIKRGYSLTILSQSEEPQSLALTVKSLFLDTLPQGSSLPLINASLEISDQRQIRLALTAVN
jgi:acyl-[acyl-carrier-protein]-phospholipid O-acyltransferase/long-chain-fatty-acid--[acyl-carrier-protein] ligase